MTRNSVLAGLLALAALAATPARADQNDSRLPALFDQLRDAESPREALLLESAIWQIWGETDDDDAGLLYRRGMEALTADRPDDAVAYFSDAIKKAPDFAEAWNKRATVLFMMGDFGRSVADVEQTLALEPRHFGALSGLGLIYLTLGRDALALKAFEAALKVHPYLPGARLKAKELREKLGGKPT